MKLEANKLTFKMEFSVEIRGIILSIYNKTFYDNQEKGSLNSAKIIVPIVMDIVKPKSVIDVGCGVGTWLSVFKQLGS